MFTIDKTRWDAIESLPLPTGVGDLTEGLCAIARIVYASTGRVSDLADADCIAPTIRTYMISLNDHLPQELRQRLGTLELAHAVLAADTSPEAELRRAYICADTAVRVFAAGALRNAGLPDEADTLAALAPITDRDSGRAAAHAACDAARIARNGFDAAAEAADAVYYAAYFAADTARDSALYATAAAPRSAAYAAADTAREAAAWEPAFELLTALLAPSTQTAL